MDTAAIKESDKMIKRPWAPVEKTGKYRYPVRSWEYDMDAAHLSECKTMNTLIKPQKLQPG
jgi:hypothetical protein